MQSVVISVLFSVDSRQLVNYLNCEKCHSAGEGSKGGHSPIIEAKDSSDTSQLRWQRNQEDIKHHFWLSWKQAKLEDVIELGLL